MWYPTWVHSRGGLIPWPRGKPLGRQEVRPKAGPKAPSFTSLQNLPIDRNLGFYWVNSGACVLLCGLCFSLKRQCWEGCSTVTRAMSQPSDSSKGPVNQTLGRKPGAGTQAWLARELLWWPDAWSNRIKLSFQMKIYMKTFPLKCSQWYSVPVGHCSFHSYRFCTGSTAVALWSPGLFLTNDMQTCHHPVTC